MVLTVSKNPSTLAKIIKWGHNIYLFGGRFNILLGFGLMMMVSGYWPTTITGYWWIILSVLSWGGVEVVSKRMIKEDDSHQDTKQDFEIQFEIISSYSVIFSALQLYYVRTPYPITEQVL